MSTEEAQKYVGFVNLAARTLKRGVREKVIREPSEAEKKMGVRPVLQVEKQLYLILGVNGSLERGEITPAEHQNLRHLIDKKVGRLNLFA